MFAELQLANFLQPSVQCWAAIQKIESSRTQRGTLFHFLIWLFFVKNPPLSLLVYSFAKLIQYFQLISYTLLTMQSRTESKNFSHPSHSAAVLWSKIKWFMIKCRVGSLLHPCSFVPKFHVSCCIGWDRLKNLSDFTREAKPSGHNWWLPTHLVKYNWKREMKGLSL